jgi:energy-coupling factor transporter transmembrane protein EcfT
METNTLDDKHIEMNFWKHALNWKYYIWSILVGIIIAFIYIGIDEDLFKLFKIVNLIIAITVTVKFKSKFIKKVAMFFFVGALANIITFTTYNGITYIYELTTNNSSVKQKYINSYLKLNDKLPRKLADGISVIKYINENNSAIILQIQFEESKENILAEFYDKTLGFENFMLENELRNSCENAFVKEFLNTGLILKMEYFDKEKKIIGKISLDKNKCSSSKN